MPEDGQEPHGAGRKLELDETPIAGPAPVTPDARWWSKLEGEHRVVRTSVVVLAVCAIALAAGAAVTLLGPTLFGRASRGGPAPSIGTPAATGTTPTTTVPAPSTTTTASDGASTPVTPNRSTFVRAALVCYREDGALWVSDEAGGSPQRIVATASGPFALSPDGRTLAFVDAASGSLSLVDIATKATTVVGLAELEDPAWSPDSSFLVYTALPAGAHDTIVRRVQRDGSGRSTLGVGARPRVAADGSVVAVSGDRSSGGVPIVVFSGDTSRTVGTGITVDAVAPATSTIAYCDAGSVGVQSVARPPQVGVIGFDGSGKRTLVKKPAAGGSAFFGEIHVSPDGGHIVYSETGDDGYSRIFSIPIAGGRPVQLTDRRDGYPMGFSADGTELFYVDGNAIQGETTQLMAVRLDGTKRRTVVTGAGL
jgi:TolB protein